MTRSCEKRFLSWPTVNWFFKTETGQKITFEIFIVFSTFQFRIVRFVRKCLNTMSVLSTFKLTGTSEVSAHLRHTRLQTFKNFHFSSSNGTLQRFFPSFKFVTAIRLVGGHPTVRAAESVLRTFSYGAFLRIGLVKCSFRPIFIRPTFLKKRKNENFEQFATSPPPGLGSLPHRRSKHREPCAALNPGFSWNRNPAYPAGFVHFRRKIGNPPGSSYMSLWIDPSTHCSQRCLRQNQDIALLKWTVCVCSAVSSEIPEIRILWTHFAPILWKGSCEVFFQLLFSLSQLFGLKNFHELLRQLMKQQHACD